MEAFLITDASFLERTEAAGVAGKIALADKGVNFIGSVNSVQNSNHAEMIAILHGFQKITKMRDEELLQIDKVHIGTDSKSAITLIEEGLRKDRFYHPMTKKLINEINRKIKVSGIDVQFHKIKAHVEHNPTPLEAIHNQVDRMAKHAMVTLMNEVEYKSIPGNHYTTLLPQTLLPGEYEKLEETAYNLAREGLSPRVLTTLPAGDNPFVDGVERFNRENPSSTLKAEIFPSFESKRNKKTAKHKVGLTGTDRIQTLDALSRMGYKDGLLLEEREGNIIADIGRAVSGFQKNPELVNESSKSREGEHSRFLLTHSASKRMSDFDLPSRKYAAVYSIKEVSVSQVLEGQIEKQKDDVEITM